MPRSAANCRALSCAFLVRLENRSQADCGTSARGSSGIVGYINGAIQLPPSRQIGLLTAPVFDRELSLPDAHDSRCGGVSP